MTEVQTRRVLHTR